MRTYLVRIFDQDVLALRLLHQDIGDSAHNTPSICKRDVQLGGKVCRPGGRRAQDDMSRVVAGIRARDVSKSR